jgi:hypothetical protein
MIYFAYFIVRNPFYIDRINSQKASVFNQFRIRKNINGLKAEEAEKKFYKKWKFITKNNDLIHKSEYLINYDLCKKAF